MLDVKYFTNKLISHNKVITGSGVDGLTEEGYLVIMSLAERIRVTFAL